MSNEILIRSLHAWVAAGAAFSATLDLGYESPSTVMTHVNKLELRAGVQLLVRDNKGRRKARLTQAGRDVLERAGLLPK